VAAFAESDVGDYITQESPAPLRHCLVASTRGNGANRATAILRLPNEEDGMAWLGLVLVGREHQRQGLGRELVRALELEVARLRWTELRLAVLTGNGAALSFWRALGYGDPDRRRDQAGRDVLVMSRRPRGD
jgi:GNAT superfamily N-acetyltransferase